MNGNPEMLTQDALLVASQLHVLALCKAKSPLKNTWHYLRLESLLDKKQLVLRRLCQCS